MRCSCALCGAYMVHHENSGLGCICPECRNTCTVCLGQAAGSPRIKKGTDGKINIPDGLLQKYGLTGKGEKEEKL